MRHYRTEILPHLEVGDVVVSDRYVFTAYAYFLARGITDLSWLKRINENVRLPDLTFYLDVSAEVALEWINKREGVPANREERDLALLSSVRRNFLEQPWGKSKDYIVVDGTRPPADISEEIRQIVLEAIKSERKA